MCLGNWLLEELLSSSKYLCLRLWVDLSQQQSHGESQGDCRFPYTSAITAFPVPSFLSSSGVSVVYQLRQITLMGRFSCFPGCFVSLCPCSLPGKLLSCLILARSASGPGSFGFAENPLLYHVCCTLLWGVGIRQGFHMYLPAHFWFFSLHS